MSFSIIGFLLIVITALFYPFGHNTDVSYILILGYIIAGYLSISSKCVYPGHYHLPSAKSFLELVRRRFYEVAQAE